MVNVFAEWHGMAHPEPADDVTRGRGGPGNAIDAGLYQEQQAAGTAPYPAFGPAQATYYIPRGQPTSGPQWFVVQVANAFRSSPARVTSDEYLLFTRPGPGSAWRNAIEPYLLASATAPQVDVSADGMATAVSPDAATLTVAPGQLPRGDRCLAGRDGGHRPSLHHRSWQPG